MKVNPYPNREHSVGKLEYELKNADLESLRQGKALAMMEYGECELMYDLPRLVGGGLIANLGHAMGGSAVLLAKGLQDRHLEGHVYSVDLFKRGRTGYTEAINDMKILGLERLVTPLRGSTEHWGKLHKGCNTEFSLVFIDADHSYEGVKGDFELWSPMIVSGGLVAFHDTNQEFSNRVLREQLIDSSVWEERRELHINRIRVFERRV